MDKKNKYDAFISYRHCELDKFVAVNLHKKLEAFKLPKDVTSPVGKTKIERVFRDQDELPLSSNLSDPINEALESSDYLVVICTPRLPESEWCKREIETFIKLHGREKVLAVLAEGEPHESFPEALTKEAYEVTNPDGSVETKYHYFEPLAADVRGKNNKEILKAMNDAVLRISASIFGLSYDDLKQRHKERAMKRTISIVSAVAAAMMLFSAVCMAMMFKIIKQSEMIMDQNDAIMSQNDEIKAQSAQIQNQNELIQDQYLQSQRNLAQATTINAKNLIGLGRFYDALYSLRKVMPSSLEDDSIPYTADSEFQLTEALELYDNPRYYFGGKTFESESIIDSVKISPNCVHVASIDACGNLHVWNIASGEEVFYKTTIPSSTSVPSEEYFVFLDDHTILYSDTQTVNKLNLQDGSSTEISNPDLPDDSTGRIFHEDGTNTYTVVSDNGITVYDCTDDSICYSLNFLSLFKEPDSLLISPLFCVGDIAESEDGKYFSFSISAMGLNDTNEYLVIINTESQKMSKVLLPEEYIFSAPIICGQNLYFRYTPDYSKTKTDSYRLVCMDCETVKELWNVETPCLKEIIKNPSFDIVYAYNSSEVYAFDSASGKELGRNNAQSTFCGMTINKKGYAKCFTEDGIYYSFSPDSDTMYPFNLFNSKPSIRINKYYSKNELLFVQFADKSYFTLYKNKNLEKKPVLECEYSSVMCVNEDDGYLRLNDSTDKIEYYPYGSQVPLMSADESNTYYSFVGDGKSSFVSYGLFGMKIYNLSDGSTIREYTDDCPGFNNAGAVTYDRKYIYSEMSYEGQIYLYNLSTGENEEIFKPNISKEENIDVYGISKEYYAVRRQSGLIEIYKGNSKEPCFSTNRSLSRREYFLVCHNANVFAITYLDGTVDFYRFGDNIEYIKTIVNPYANSNVSLEFFEYYPDQNIYTINICSKTFVLNEDFDAKTLVNLNAYYFPKNDCFVFHDGSDNCLYSIEHYSYDDLIAESDRRLGDYLPPKRIMQQYGIIE